MDLLEKEKIDNLDIILKIIDIDTNFEHIGDIISLLNKYDKKRELDSLELKKAIYTIIKIMIEELNFKPIKNLKTMIVLSNLNDVFEYLEQNWFESDAREYLLFFIKPK